MPSTAAAETAEHVAAIVEADVDHLGRAVSIGKLLPTEEDPSPAVAVP